MSEKDEFVNKLYDMQQKIDYETKRIKNDAVISPANKKDALAFLEWCELRGNAGRPPSIARVSIYAQRLLILARLFGEKNFRTATKTELEAVASLIERRKVSEASN